MFWIITKLGPEMGDMQSRIGVGSMPVTPGSQDRVRHMKKLAPNAESLQPMIDGFADSLPFEFRLLDSDNEVHFEGRCGEIDNVSGDLAFDPQETFENDTGVTATQFRMVGSQEWEWL